MLGEDVFARVGWAKATEEDPARSSQIKRVSEQTETSLHFNLKHNPVC